MNLFVDAGNTRVKWRLVNSAMQCVDSGAVVNSELNFAYLQGCLKGSNIKNIYISNVADEGISSYFNQFAEVSGAKVSNVCVKSRMSGLSLNYSDLNRLGVDRALAMIGGFRGKGVLIIDAGSAITADFVNSKGEYLGGYILAGLKMSQNLLISNTARVGVLADIGNAQPGLSTGDCVNNGVTIMYQSLLVGLIDMARSKNIDSFLVTGGDAKLFQQWSNGCLVFSENLVLDGLVKYCLEGCGIESGDV